MRKTHGVVLGVLLGLSAQAGPLTGSFANKNPDVGEAMYHFKDQLKKVFVFHSFSVQVC